MCNLHCCFGTFFFLALSRCQQNKRATQTREGRRIGWRAWVVAREPNQFKSRIRKKKRTHSHTNKDACLSFDCVAWKRRMVGVVLCLFVDMDGWFVIHALCCLYACVYVFASPPLDKHERKKKADLSFNPALTLPNLLLFPFLQRNFHSFLVFLCPLLLLFFRGKVYNASADKGSRIIDGMVRCTCIHRLCFPWTH